MHTKEERSWMCIRMNWRRSPLQEQWSAAAAAASNFHRHCDWRHQFGKEHYARKKMTWKLGGVEVLAAHAVGDDAP